MVVGAGPAGLYTAGMLAQKGLETLVLEAKDEVGKNVICTGIIGKESFEQFGFSNEQIVRSIQDVRIDSPSGTSLFYRHPLPFAFVVERQRFDKYLLKLALDKGAEVVLQCNATDAIIDETGVQIECTSNGSGHVRYKGKTLVLATGIEYELNKKLGLGYPVSFIKAAQKHLKFSKNDDVTLIIGNKLAKGGFGWIVPVGDNMARVGLISKTNPKIGFKNIIERYFPEEDDMSLQIKPIAQGIVSKTFGNRVLAVGEAAGQVKATTGGGIYFGLLCAEIAANVINDAFKKGDLSENKFYVYEKRWKSEIGKEIRLGAVARNLCGRLKDPQIEKIFNTVQSNGYFDYIASHANFDRHGSFVLSFLKMLY
ncbi:MAG: NAD(P)/FAD-dependent oxidoreductase [Proteobacteria bacterium]|nr:NAD(P)/FAD-dependent oxidoreductase [Pseudomonadota bacterium]